MNHSDQYSIPQIRPNTQGGSLIPVSRAPLTDPNKNHLSTMQQQRQVNHQIQQNSQPRSGSSGYYDQSIENSPIVNIGSFIQRKSSNNDPLHQPYINPNSISNMMVISNRAKTNNKVRVSNDVIFNPEDNPGVSEGKPFHLINSEGKNQKRVRAYNKIIQDFKNKYYRKQITPNRAKLDVESLYQENIQLKFQLNQLEKALKEQNTQNQLLNNDLERQFQIILNGYLEKAKGNTGGNKTTQLLIMNLRRDYDTALKEIRQKNEIIDNLEKNKTITKIRELEEERNAYMNECARLHTLLTKFKAKGKAYSPTRSQIEDFIQQEEQQKQQIANEAFQNAQQYQDILQEMRNQLDQALEENSELQEKNEKCMEQIQKLEDGLRSQKEQMEELIKIIDSDQKGLENLEKAKEDLKNAQEKIKKMQRQHDDEIKKLRVQYEELEEENQVLIEKVNERNLEKDNLESQLSKVQQDFKKANEVGSKVQKKKDKIKALKEKLCEKEEKITELELKLEELNYQQDQSELEEMKSKYQLQIQELKDLLAEKQSSLQNVEGDLDYKIQERDKTIQNLREQIEQMTYKSPEDSNENTGQKQISSTGNLDNSDQNLESQLMNLKEIHEKILQEKEQQIYDLELQLQEAKHPIQKKDSNISDEYNDLDKQNLKELEDQKKDLDEQIKKQQETIDNLKDQLTAQEKQVSSLNAQIETLTQEQNDQVKSVQSKIQRVIHILHLNNLPELLKFLKGGLLRGEESEVKDILVVQFGISLNEAGLIQEHLKIGSNIDDLAEKLLDEFGKPLEISEQQINQIGEKIQEAIPNSNFEQFLLQHEMPANRLIHYLQVENILKPFISSEEIYLLQLYLHRKTRNFTQIDCQRLIKIVNPHLALYSHRFGGSDFEGQGQSQPSLNQQPTIEESTEILQLAGRMSQISNQNPLDMSLNQDRPTVQLKIQQNNSFQILTKELKNQESSHFRKLIQIFHNTSLYPGKEVEIVLLKDFFQVLQKLKLQHLLEGQGKQQIIDGLETLDALVIDTQTKQQVVVLAKLMEGFKYCGYQDLQKPKSKKNFDFEGLDVKSVRVMNRLCYVVIRKQLPPDFDQSTNSKLIQLFRPVLFQCLVKTLSKEERVVLLNKDKFYKRLVEIGVRKKDKEIPQLSHFLQIDQSYPHLLLFKKLVRAIEEFSKNEHFKMIGMRRAKLEDQKKQLSIVPEDEEAEEKKREEQEVNQVKLNQQEEVKEEDEYEYYDEDEAVEEEKKVDKKEVPKQKTEGYSIPKDDYQEITGESHQKKSSQFTLGQFTQGRDTDSPKHEYLKMTDKNQLQMGQTPNFEKDQYAEEEYEYYDEDEEEALNQQQKPVMNLQKEVEEKKQQTPIPNSQNQQLPSTLPQIEQKPNNQVTPNQEADDYEYYDEDEEEKQQPAQQQQKTVMNLQQEVEKAKSQIPTSSQPLQPNASKPPLGQTQGKNQTKPTPGKPEQDEYEYYDEEY